MEWPHAENVPWRVVRRVRPGRLAVTRRARASSRGVAPMHARRPPVWGTMVVATMGAASLACSQADSQRTAAAAAATAATAVAARAPATLPLLTGGAGYHAGPLTGSGRITGTVEFNGSAPTDSIIHPASDADVCGPTLVDVSVDHRGPRLARAVVWISGVAAGKPMSYVRRFDITSAGCRFVPRVQTAVVGGTLDVRNADPTTHHARFLREPADVLLTMIAETEAGAVVPSGAILTTPGLIQVRCDDHPWARAWIAVFDHPYFAATDANGVFAIDSVPPGRYRISVWHERFGIRTDSVTVVAGQDVAVGLKY
jgi:carboxypeptidase family protein